MLDFGQLLFALCAVAFCATSALPNRRTLSPPATRISAGPLARPLISGHKHAARVPSLAPFARGGNDAADAGDLIFAQEF